METTTPLSGTEREDFRLRFRQRLEKVKAKTSDVFAFKAVREMLDGLSLEGLIIDSQFTPRVALLKGGKSVQVERPLTPGRRSVRDFLHDYFQSRRDAVS